MAKELGGCTFKPKTKAAASPPSSVDVVERLRSYGEQRKQEKEARRKTLEKEEMEKCSFKPNKTHESNGRRSQKKDGFRFLWRGTASRP